jgi:uncharacterized membrane protein
MDFILRIYHDLTHVHPPHPMVVHFPIALTGAALFFILLALWRRSHICEQIAFADLALATVCAIPAAAFGIRDNIILFGGKAPNHDAKIILAIIFFLISTVTIGVRWKRKIMFQDKASQLFYAAACFICFALVAVLAFLGGVITYGF